MKILKILIPIFLLFTTEEAHAFALLWLFDSGFQKFILIKMPLVSIISMTLWETVAVIKIFKPENKSFFKLAFSILQVNFFSMLFNLIIVVILFVIVSDAIMTDLPPIAGGIAAGYFVIAFTYAGWTQKTSVVKKFLANDEKSIGGSMFIVNAVSYATLFSFLYLHLF